MQHRFLTLVLVFYAASSSAQEDLLACVDPDVRQGLLSPMPGGSAVVTRTVPDELSGLTQSEDLEFIGSSVSDSQTFVAYKSALATNDAMDTASATLREAGWSEFAVPGAPSGGFVTGVRPQFDMFCRDNAMLNVMDIGEFSGTATSGREILLSFKGRSGMWEGDLREDWFGRVVFPNLVHSAHMIWWGFPDTHPAPPFWLIQGLSGYLALKYAHGAGGQEGEQTFLSEMEQMASECLNILEEGNFGIARASAQAGTTIHDECGVFAFWLIDGQPRTAHRAERLRAVMAHMKEMPGNLSVGKLRRAMESEGAGNAWEPLLMLIQGPRGRLWQRRSQLLVSG